MKTRLLRKPHVILAIVALMILPFARVSPVTADPDPDAPELLLTELVVTPTEGESVEIHNPTGATIDLSDVYLTDATFAGGDTYYYNIVTGSNAGGGGFYDFHARFPDGATIAADEYQTIALNGSDNFLSEYGVDPTYELYEDADSADGIPDMREALSGSIDDQGGLSNGAEVVILYYWDGESDLVTDLDYALWGDKDEAVDKTGVSIDGPDADATDSSYLLDTPVASQDIIAGGAHASGNSWQRDDLTEGAETETGGNGVSGDDETSEDLSNTWCDSPATPGEESACEEEVETGGCGDPATLISAVQGDGSATPLEGQQVVIEGIVVGDFQWGGDDDGDLGGFYVQEEDEDADGDPLTSEGVFVYDGSFGVDVEVGDRVRVNGVPAEQFGLTQIGSLSDVLLCDSGNTVTPVDVTLPLASVDEPETYEGMSVELDQPLVISEFYNFDYVGEVVLTTDRQFQPTAIYEPDAPEREQLAEQNMLNRVQLEDGFSASNVDPARHPDGDEFTLEHRFRGGDLIQNISGVMSYGYGSYEIQPTAGADYTAVNERPAEPDDVGGDVTAAAFNVLNYFTTLDAGEEICGPDGDMDCRGANTAEEFTRQQAKIVEAMCAIDADVFGLVELENQNPDNDPDPGDGIEDYVLKNLTAALNDVDSPCPAKIYTFTDSAAAGTDAIRQGIIYKSGVLTPTGRAVLTDTAFTDPNDLGQQKNRPAVAETFEDANGESFTVVANHLKSKGSECGEGDDDPVQGSCNDTRTKAADYLGDWLATDPTGSGDPDFLILGDLNAYDKEDPIDELVNDGYTDLVADYQGEYAYSYVFDGQLGYLDYGMANEDLLPQVTGATVWNINTDEPDILDYDMTYKKPAQDALYQENPYRSSDHDPVIVGLRLSQLPYRVNLPLLANNYAPPQEVFTLGILGPFTGPSAPTGEEFKGAVNMAFDAIGWRIGDYHIEPVWIDSESGSAKAADNYEAAILQDGVQAGLLNWYSSVAVPCMEVVADHQVPHFASFGATEVVNETFNGDRERYGYWTTKMWPTPTKLNVSYVDMLEAAIASGAWSPAAKTVVISGEDTEWGRGFGDAIKAHFQDAGWTILAEEYFTPGQTDFSAILPAIKALDPAVVAGSTYASDSAHALINQADAAGLQSVIIADGFGWTGDWYGATGDSSNYVLDQMTLWATDEAKAFKQAYQNRYGSSPSAASAGMAYDAANFFINIAEQVYQDTGELSSDAIYQFVQDEVWTGQWTYTDGILFEEYKYNEQTIPDSVVGDGYYMFPVLQYFDGQGKIVYPPAWADQSFTPPPGG